LLFFLAAVGRGSHGGARQQLIYNFEDYALDIGRRGLRRRSDVIPVEPQVFDLLLHLIQNRDHVVSKDDYRSSVEWPCRFRIGAQQQNYGGPSRD
jgi:DNA-binding response OmpR family regulator